MNNPDRQLEERSTAEIIGEYAALLWRWAWLLILLTVVAGFATYQFTVRQTPIYQASTLVMVNGAPGTSVDSYTTIYMGQQLAQTYAQVMVTKPMLDSVAELLGLDYFPASVTVSPIANTQLMRVNVQDTDPDRAALIANTLVSVFAEQLSADQAARYADSKRTLETQLAVLQSQIEITTNSLNAYGDLDQNLPEQVQLQTTLAQYRNSYAYLLQSYESIRLAEAQSASNIVQKDPAVPRRSPIQPQPMRSAMLGAVVGLMIGAGIIFLTWFLDDTLRDPEEITRKWGVPILGMISNFKTNGDALITVHQPRSPVSESFRSLRTNLQYASIDKPLRSILVTSPSPEDGKSTIAANLAAVVAQSGKKVVLLDADLRRPRVHTFFKLSNRFGMTDLFIQNNENMPSAVQGSLVSNLDAITSGGLPPNPSELLSSNKMIELIKTLGENHDLVILDTPPMLVVTDASVLAPRVDGVILVVKPSVTKRAAVKHVIEQLQRGTVNLLGVVLNDVKLGRGGYSYYRGYHYYGKNKSGYHYYSDDGNQQKVEAEPAQSRTDEDYSSSGRFRRILREKRDLEESNQEPGDALVVPPPSSSSDSISSTDKPKSVLEEISGRLGKNRK